MEPEEIKPGCHYLVTDPYEEAIIVVRVVGPSEKVEEHWSCVRRDGRKILLPASAFIRPALGFA